jgi:hypothetical protein
MRGPARIGEQHFSHRQAPITSAFIAASMLRHRVGAEGGARAFTPSALGDIADAGSAAGAGGPADLAVTVGDCRQEQRIGSLDR